MCVWFPRSSCDEMRSHFACASLLLLLVICYGTSPVSSASTARTLHWVFKIGDRNATLTFYQQVLGWKVLRHEEFIDESTGHQTSRTMIGADHEDTKFVSELGYDYDVHRYVHGSDDPIISLTSGPTVQRLKQGKVPFDTISEGVYSVKDPDGYEFRITDGPQETVDKVTVKVQDLKRALDFWRKTLGMSVVSQSQDSVLLQYASDQCKVQLIATGHPVIHDTAIGRIAIACSWDEQQEIRDRVKLTGVKVMEDLTEMPTPGKATVRVLIFVDRDGYEVCFVGDEGYRDLSDIDTESEDKLRKAIDDELREKQQQRRG